MHAAETALRELLTAETAENAEKSKNNLKLAGIAKREEEIYFSASPLCGGRDLAPRLEGREACGKGGQGTTKPLRLPRHSPVLKLLQYVRDEAHRFAQHYFHILHRKKTLGF